MKRDFASLLSGVAAELERGRGRGVGLQLVCDLMQREVDGYDWFGFYLVVPDQRILVLGPYQGESTEHVRIPFGRGICGQTAETGRTTLVADVSREANYLSCSVRVRSEIVVPVWRNEAMIAQIDVDSHTPAAFTEADRAFLEQVAVLVEPYIPDVSAQPDPSGA